MTPHEFGLRAEQLAAIYLQVHGYRVLARRCQLPAGELDLVALRGSELLCVEVKARRSDRFGSPLEAINSAKRRRLRRALAWFRTSHPQLEEKSLRCDVFSVQLQRKQLQCRWFRSIC